ncbi:MAG: hypothetical protein GC204_06850 [Chloroflexi bacterium]|nr:hypothetical protein [Chloroflexota bacterium]
MQLTERNIQRLTITFVIVTMLVQIVTHLGWLSISAHSGQVAIPWMMNQGRTMFGDLLEQHAPGVTVVAALAMRLLPMVEPILVTRLLNLLLVLAMTVLIFALARSLTGNLGSVIATLMWFWWEPVYGNILFYFDTVVGALAMLVVLLWIALAPRKPGWLAPLVAGFLMGTATVAKQHAWAAVVLFALWLFLYERRRLGVFIAAVLVLPLAMIGVVALQGNLQNYLYWNWQFNFSGLMSTIIPTGDFIRKLVFSNSFVPPFLLLALARRNKLLLLIVLMWLAGAADLVPSFGELHEMVQLPFACVMGGMVLATLMPELKSVRLRRDAPIANMALVGLVSALLLGWLWTGAVVYVPSPLGRAGIPAYDELKPVAAALEQVSQPGDTLFVLPETDSTPQLHLLTGMLPPGTWVKGWYWYLEAPGMADQLLNEWSVHPPSEMVYFPDLILSGHQGMERLEDFMKSHYTPVETVKDVLFHGDGIIYRLNGSP